MNNSKTITSERRFEYLMGISARKIPVLTNWMYECTDDDGLRFCEPSLNQLFVRLLVHRHSRVKKRAEYRCENCFAFKPLQIHHREHRSQGGRHTMDNLFAHCAECHHNTHAASGLLKKLKSFELSASAQERIEGNE